MRMKIKMKLKSDMGYRIWNMVKAIDGASFLSFISYILYAIRGFGCMETG